MKDKLDKDTVELDLKPGTRQTIPNFNIDTWHKGMGKSIDDYILSLDTRYARLEEESRITTEQWESITLKD